MAVAELLHHLLCTPEGIGKTALVVGRTHSHVKNQLLPIFRAILSMRDGRGKEVGVGESNYHATQAPR
jgi:hypothetical protein